MVPRTRWAALASPSNNFEWISLAVMGAAFCVGSLSYPLVLDGAVNHYVAREWLLNGALPYRDSFDHRAPGIYLVHVACLVVFGAAPYGIRIAEILAMVGSARLAAAAVTPMGSPVPRATWAAAFFGGCLLYYGFFDYWCTAQCEIWVCLAALGAIAAATRTRSLPLAATLVGLCAGAALLVKPPGVLLVLAAGVHLGRRWRSEGGGAGAPARFALAAAAGPAMLAAYFAARGGLPALLDVLIGDNARYVAAEPQEAHTAAELLKAWRFFAPFSILIAVAPLALAVRASLFRGRERAGSGLVLGALVLSVAVVAIQRKFFLYHWGVLVFPITLLAASFARAVLGRRGSTWKLAVATATALAFYSGTGWPCAHWLASTRTAALWSAGRIDHDTYVASFVGFQRFYGHTFRYSDRERVGEWLRAHSAPEDELIVRGMAAEIYLLADRRAPSRFFWSLFLTEPTRTYHRDEWLREDADALAHTPPRWVVTYSRSSSPVESIEGFEGLGYRPRLTAGELVVLELTQSPIASAPRSK